MLNVGRIEIPIVGLAFFHRDGLPGGIAIKHRCIFFAEHGSVYFRHRLCNFCRAGPHIFQVNVFTLRILPQWLFVQINFYTACQCIGHHQWWRSQPVGFHQWMHTAFKVTVARQNGGHGQIALVNRFFNFFGQWARVTNTSGTAIAHQIKAQLV